MAHPAGGAGRAAVSEAPGVTAAIGLGANLGDPRAQIEAALAALAQLPHSTLIARSSLYRTAPLGKTDQPDFFNAVALLSTRLPAAELLGHLLDIENRHGRLRAERNGPRTLDLDLLLHGDEQLHGERLTLPHPRMHQRRFVLEPLLEIAPGSLIPGHGHAAACLAHIPDTPDQRVERLPP